MFWIMLLGSLFLTNFAAYRALNGNDFLLNYLIISGMLLSVIIWVIILMDIIKSTIPSKTVWIVCMLLFGPITEIVYLIRRKNLKLKEADLTK